MDPAELTNLVKHMARTIDELREEIASLREEIASLRKENASLREAISSERPKAAGRRPRRRRQPEAPGPTPAEVEELIRRFKEDELEQGRREAEEFDKAHPWI